MCDVYKWHLTVRALRECGRHMRVVVALIAVEFVLSPTEGGLPPCVRNSARLRLEGPPRSLAVDM